MVLGAEVEGVAIELHDLHALALGVPSHELQPGFLQGFDHVRIDLVAVAVALVDLHGAAVESVGFAAGVLQQGRAAAEAHRRAHVGGAAFGHEDDHRVGGLLVELGAVRPLHPQHVAGELDHGDLHSEADPEIRNLVLAGVLCGDRLAFDAADAEPARHQHAVGRLQVGPSLRMLLW